MDARTGDNFLFIAVDDVRFRGLILDRDELELDLVHVRWADGHESWTPLQVQVGTVEVWRDGEQVYA